MTSSSEGSATPEMSAATKQLINDYAIANAPKERKSSLELCGLANTQDVRRLERQMDDNYSGPRGRRMSVPVLPSQHKPKDGAIGRATGSKTRDTNDAISEVEATNTVYTPKESNARTELAHLKKDLRMLRPKSINELRLSGDRKSQTGRHHPDAQSADDSSLGEQFESLRLCRYLRQPGHELQELDVKDIFKGD